MKKQGKYWIKFTIKIRTLPADWYTFRGFKLLQVLTVRYKPSNQTDQAHHSMAHAHPGELVLQQNSVSHHTTNVFNALK